VKNSGNSPITVILDRFDQAWELGVPEIEAFLPRDESAESPTRRDILIELVMVDLERRWRASGATSAELPTATGLPTQPNLEDYLERYPLLGSLDTLPLPLICEEYRVRQRWGDRPGHDEYLFRFPAHSEGLLVALKVIDGKREIDATLSVQHRRHVSGIYHTGGRADNQHDTQPPSTIGTSQGSTIRNAAASPPISQEFGDYVLLEEIAHGGMGIVYKARQKKANRIVALKMILSGQLAGEEEVKRFYTEAEAAANLDHPCIVPIYDVGDVAGQHYFSMGFVAGKSLKDRVKDGPLPPREAAELLKMIADAVAYAHENGVIHRDLKPANVLLDQDDRPRITDFGLAKQLEADSDLTATGQIMGTPSYMPPEQAAGKTDQVGPAADVYSLGAVLYELLTGRPPFQAAHVIDTLRQVLDREPVALRRLNRGIPGDLETITLKCLGKEAERRFPSARELCDDLSRFLHGQPISARRTSPPMRAWKWCRRNRAIAAAVFTIVMLLIVGTSILTLILVRSYQDVVAANFRTSGHLLQQNRAHSKEVGTLLDEIQDSQHAQATLRDQLAATRDELAMSEASLQLLTDFVVDQSDSQVAAAPHAVYLESMDIDDPSLLTDAANANVFQRFGDAYLRRGYDSRAVESLQFALAGYLQSNRIVDPNTRMTFGALTTALVDSNQFEEARRVVSEYERLVAAWSNRPRIVSGLQLEKVFDEALWHSPQACEALAVAHGRLGNHSRARELLEFALELSRQGQRVEEKEFVSLLLSSAENALAMQRLTEAEKLAAECDSLASRITGPRSWESACAKVVIGAVRLEQGNFRKAEPLLVGGYRQLRQQTESIPLPVRFRVGESLRRVTTLYKRWHKPDELQRWERESGSQ